MTCTHDMHFFVRLIAVCAQRCRTGRWICIRRRVVRLLLLLLLECPSVRVSVERGGHFRTKHLTSVVQMGLKLVTHATHATRARQITTRGHVTLARLLNRR